MEETWKDIPGYEGLYRVSNMGRVKSLDKSVYVGRHKALINMLGQIININLTTTGYHKVDLNHNGKRKSFKIHRLVAQCFISNPENKPQVNHINGIRTDNRLENLEWVTASENMRHSFSVLKRKNPHGFTNKLSKGVVQISLDGFLLNVFGSRNEASRATGVPPSNINRCVTGKWSKAGGYIWA